MWMKCSTRRGSAWITLMFVGKREYYWWLTLEHSVPCVHSWGYNSGPESLSNATEEGQQTATQQNDTFVPFPAKMDWNKSC